MIIENMYIEQLSLVSLGSVICKPSSDWLLPSSELREVLSGCSRSLEDPLSQSIRDVAQILSRLPNCT